MSNMILIRFNLFTLLKYPYLVFSPFFSKVISLVLSKNSHVTYSSGTFKVIFEKHFYKFGSLWGPLNKEKQSAEYILKEYNDLKSLLPQMCFTQRGFIQFVKLPLYREVPPSQGIDCAYYVLSTLRMHGVNKSVSLTDFPYLQKGMRLAKMLFKLENLEEKLTKMLSLGWHVGPAHGDFHRKNIMINSDEKPVMIDLDNFQSQGIQALDAFTFCVDSMANENALRWQDVIDKRLIETSSLKAFFDNDTMSISILYVLNRLGYENAHYKFLSRSFVNEFSILKKLMEAQEGK